MSERLHVRRPTGGEADRIDVTGFTPVTAMAEEKKGGWDIFPAALFSYRPRGTTMTTVGGRSTSPLGKD